MKTILHLDMNSYFATAEQQANPYLRGKPVGIVKAEGRGCVIAASIEAKKYGVKTGITVWEARKLCPGIILVPSDMDKYFSLTKKLVRIMEAVSPTLEIFSIDEVFVDITCEQEKYSGRAYEMALLLKWRIREELGEWMKCSVGIGFSKLTAKLASEMNKPDGLTFLTPDDCLARTEKVAAGEVCGIGYARTRWLAARGAFTLGQARRIDLPAEIADLVWLRADEPLVTREDLQPAKSVSRTFTTFRELSGQREIEQLVRNLIEETAAKLREMQMAGRTVTLSLTPGRGEVWFRQSFWARETIAFPTDDPLAIFNLLWRKYMVAPVNSVRFAGVSVSNLVFNCQLPVFGERAALLRAADKVNDKWGLFTIYPARLLRGELIRPEVTGYLGDKWYRFGPGKSGG